MHSLPIATHKLAPLKMSFQCERKLSKCVQKNSEIHLLYITWTLPYIRFSISYSCSATLKKQVNYRALNYLNHKSSKEMLIDSLWTQL